MSSMEVSKQKFQTQMKEFGLWFILSGGEAIFAKWLAHKN
jgi:hypothetical protein